MVLIYAVHKKITIFNKILDHDVYVSVYNNNQGGVEQMEKYRTIPGGYMRIGEMAKKGGITVRALSYYDKEGLLTPSAESEGGYRLYTDKDLVKLLQILMMKRLGFTLKEIKKRIVAMDTTFEVINVLAEQATNIRTEIDHLTESLNALESLKEEIIQVDSVDFKKFADILAHLQMKNERYWLVKYLDNDVLDTLMTYNEAWSKENAEKMIEATNSFINEAARLHFDGISPESEQGRNFAERYWKWIMEVTGGDMNLVKRISEQASKSTSDQKHDERMEKATLFMKSSLGMYFNNGFMGEAAKLYDDGVVPESEKGQDFAKRYWKWLMEISGGDMAKLQEMNEQFGNNAADSDEISKKSQLFMGSSLQIYFANLQKEDGNNA